MKKIRIKEGTRSGGHYSPAVITEAKKLMFISGMPAVDPHTGHLVSGDLETQARQCLKNIQYLLDAAGAEVKDIVKITIYLIDGEKWVLINKLFHEFFGTHRPARTIIPVTAMHNKYEIQIEAVVEIND